MNFTEVYDIIKLIEEKYPINNWMIENIRIWPLIKSKIVTNLTINEEIIGVTKKNSHFKYIKNFIPSFISYFKVRIFDITKNSKIKKVDVVIRSCTTDRTFLLDKYYDKICDPLIDELKLNNISFLDFEISDNNGYYKYPRYNPSYLIFAKSYIAKIKALLKFKLISNNLRTNSAKYSDMRQFLVENYKFNIGAFETFFGDFFLIQGYCEVYTILMQKSMPKIGIVMNYYSTEGMGFILACKKLNIISADIQHGLQGDYHPAYGGFNNVTEEGYELLPTYFFVWSENEKNTIDKWAFKTNKKHQAVNIGNLWLDMWKDNGNSLVGRVKNQYEMAVLKIKKAINILITLQLSNIPINLLLAIKQSDSDVMWWIRMHPVFGRDHQEISNQLGNLNNFNIHEATSIPLNILLLNADAHVTEFSSSTIEAAYFNVPTLLISQKGIENFKTYIDTGMAKSALSTDEILRNLKILVKQNLKHQSNIFEKGKFEAFINTIIK